jgi:DNA helicase-4
MGPAMTSREPAAYVSNAHVILTAFQKLDANWPRHRYVRRSDIVAWMKGVSIPCSTADAKSLASSLDVADARELERLALQFNRPIAAIDGQNAKWVAQALERERETFDRLNLTENQRRAVLTDADITLVVAGAGTGKSTTIVHKIDYLIRAGLARPHEILVLAYNKEAQLLLQERISELPHGSEVRPRTFHAFGYGVISQGRQTRPDAFPDSDVYQFIFATLHRWRRAGDVPSKIAEALRVLAPDFASTEKLQSFASSISSMLARFKTRRLDVRSMQRRATSPRQRAFLTLFTAIHDLYTANLRERNAVDFSDMITLATDAIEAGAQADRFRYILIDEFQDITPARWRMVSALREKNPGTALFLVGDDWQSIYAFDDADVSIMTGLEQRERGVVRIDLDTTFRFGAKTAAISSRFVMRNPNQLRKEIVSAPTAGDGRLVITHHAAAQKDNQIRAILDEVAASRPGVKSVLILGRYRKGRPDAFDKLVAHGRSHGLRVAYSTCHSAKGLEADEVIIVDLVSGVTGFPSRIPDDEIMDLAPTRQDPFPDGEERRLFYVAITRSRGFVHLLTDEKRRSSFIEELLPKRAATTPAPKRVSRPGEKAAAIPVVAVFGRVPHCATCNEPTMIRRDGKRGPFWGCKTFPDCWGKPKKCPYCGAMAWMLDGPHGNRFCGECGKP